MADYSKKNCTYVDIFMNKPLTTEKIEKNSFLFLDKFYKEWFVFFSNYDTIYQNVRKSNIFSSLTYKSLGIRL